MAWVSDPLDITLVVHKGKQKRRELQPLPGDKTGLAKWVWEARSTEPGPHALLTRLRCLLFRTRVGLLVRKSWISQGKAAGESAAPRKES